ncbi:MAG: TnsA endonuclease N-terminal domain-containing protein [Aeriscardovia sp.]|nr:TnsA endonuclease N-terminal domain-containing protein [Aeriscardovia sp.]
MRKKKFKGRCEKRKIDKFGEICRTYDSLQYKTALILSGTEEVKEIQANVPMDGTEYTTDFIYKTIDGELAVRECVYREHLRKPMTLKLLDISREYWLKRGITDWAIVLGREEGGRR